MDISSGAQFVDVMSHVKPKVMIVTAKDIEAEQEKIDLSKSTIIPIPGTLKIHQIIVKSQEEVLHRNLSCFCDSSCVICKDKLKHANVVEKTKQNVKESKDSNNIMKENLKQKTTKSEPKHEMKAKKPEKPKQKNKDGLYKKNLEEMNKCKTFPALVRKCKSISKQVSESKFGDFI
jgi:hypothetical protein